VEIPPKLPAGGIEQRKTLGIRDNLRCIESVTDRIDQLVTMSFVNTVVRSGKLLGCANSLLFQRGENPGLDRCVDGGNDNRLFDRGLKSPFAGPFLSRSIKNDVDQGLACFGILLQKDVGGNLDQKTVQIAAVPLGEYVVQFLTGKAQQITEDSVSFADELHVSVFDAVMDHFDIVARTIRSHISATRFSVDLGGDLLANGCHNLPGAL
jgi:hypothetical protein